MSPSRPHALSQSSKPPSPPPPSASLNSPVGLGASSQISAVVYGDSLRFPDSAIFAVARNSGPPPTLRHLHPHPLRTQAQLHEPDQNDDPKVTNYLDFQSAAGDLLPLLFDPSLCRHLGVTLSCSRSKFLSSYSHNASSSHACSPSTPSISSASPRIPGSYPSSGACVGGICRPRSLAHHHHHHHHGIIPGDTQTLQATAHHNLLAIFTCLLYLSGRGGGRHLLNSPFPSDVDEYSDEDPSASPSGSASRYQNRVFHLASSLLSSLSLPLSARDIEIIAYSICHIRNRTLEAQARSRFRTRSPSANLLDLPLTPRRLISMIDAYFGFLPSLSSTHPSKINLAPFPSAPMIRTPTANPCRRPPSSGLTPGFSNRHLSPSEGPNVLARLGTTLASSVSADSTVLIRVSPDTVLSMRRPSLATPRSTGRRERKSSPPAVLPAGRTGVSGAMPPVAVLQPCADGGKEEEPRFANPNNNDHDDDDDDDGVSSSSSEGDIEGEQQGRGANMHDEDEDAGEVEGNYRTEAAADHQPESSPPHSPAARSSVTPRDGIPPRKTPQKAPARAQNAANPRFDAWSPSTLVYSDGPDTGHMETDEPAPTRLETIRGGGTAASSGLAPTSPGSRGAALPAPRWKTTEIPCPPRTSLELMDARKPSAKPGPKPAGRAKWSGGSSDDDYQERAPKRQKGTQLIQLGPAGRGGGSPTLRRSARLVNNRKSYRGM
ncbi:hypothetical protein MKZ38_009201 [Zalerion maritima]|uniref:Uncharacterized protein n=1 Tax=Zalerion maritima TaxID=339359 RepID=A0AAD5RGY6_9PEZI|nr:hypothetical protein MKZ38_009201 [Zalerion maritima]